MQITDVRVRKITSQNRMKAIASVTFDDVFVVHDIKVIEGEKGLFIAMPSKKAADGEFRDINQYPGQLGAQGALFKWFKMKFIPGGKFASRPVLSVDGDESFTKVGIERVISKEVSMVRNYDWDFYEKR